MKRVKTGLRVTMLDSFSNILIRLFDAAPELANDSYLSMLMSKIRDLSTRMTTAIKIDHVSSTLAVADSKRDDIIRLLQTMLVGYVASPIAERRAAAESVLAMVTKYKGITTESYGNESALIESLLGELSDETVSNSITELEGVADRIAQLRAAQDAFNAANDAYTAANAARGESATSLKKPLLEVINEKLVPYLTAMNDVNPAMYSDFAAKVDIEVVRANASVPKRGKKDAAAGTMPISDNFTEA